MNYPSSRTVDGIIIAHNSTLCGLSKNTIRAPNMLAVCQYLPKQLQHSVDQVLVNWWAVQWILWGSWSLDCWRWRSRMVVGWFMFLLFFFSIQQNKRRTLSSPSCRWRGRRGTLKPLHMRSETPGSRSSRARSWPACSLVRAARTRWTSESLFQYIKGNKCRCTIQLRWWRPWD